MFGIHLLTNPEEWTTLLDTPWEVLSPTKNIQCHGSLLRSGLTHNKPLNLRGKHEHMNHISLQQTTHPNLKLTGWHNQNGYYCKRNAMIELPQLLQLTHYFFDKPTNHRIGFKPRQNKNEKRTGMRRSTIQRCVNLQRLWRWKWKRLVKYE